MTSFALKVTRLGFAGLGRVAPGAAGRIAFQLFCRTPSRKPKGAKALAAFKSGCTRLREAERIGLAVAGGAVAAYRLRAGETSPRVLLVHGWGARAEYMADLALAIHAAGAEVVLLDLPGHGRSYGGRLDMRIAAEAIVAAEARLGPFEGAVGHSFGGAALMTAVGGIFPGVPAFQATRLSVIGSPSEITEVFTDFSRMLRLSPAVRRTLLAKAEQVAGCPPEEFDTVSIAGRIGRPLLVVHAEDDKEVGVHHAQRYATAGDGVSFLWANGYGHRRIVSAPEVSAAVSEFLLQDHAPACHDTLARACAGF